MSVGSGKPTEDRKLRVLILEDVVTDAELCERELRQAGLRFQSRRVETRAAYEAALDEFVPDLVISDFSLPGAFDGLTALEMARRKLPEVPFVFVSGTIGEERAVEAMKRGATDYVLKDRLNRLVPVVKRALQEADERLARKRSEEALRESEYRLDLALEASDLAVWDWNLATGEVRFSRHWWPILGYTPDDIPLRVEAWEKLTHPDDLVRVKSMLAATVKGAVPVLDVEYRMRAKNGEWRWIRTVGRVVERDAAGRALRKTGTHGDITEHKLQELKIVRLNRVLAVLSGINSAIVRIRNRQELFNEACRIAVEHGNFGIATIGLLDPQSLDVTPAAWAGIDAELAVTMKSTANPNVRLGQGTTGRSIRERKPVFNNDIAANPDAGSKRPEAIRRGYRSVIALPLVVEETVVGVFTLFGKEPNFFNEDELKLLTELAGDISFALDHIEKTEKLDYLAYYDGLTGLPNRNLFHERVGQLIHLAAAEQHGVAVVVLDLERFRNINETLGIAVGDTVLKTVAGRLAAAVGETGTAARISADCFAIALGGIRDEAGFAHMLEQRILAALSEPLTVADQELRMPVKAGIAVHPDDGADAASLFVNAEAALLKAKQSGDRFLFYAPQMNARVAEQLKLENQLRLAVLEEQFVLHYQPRVELASGRVSGLEALIRWAHPERGLVPPGEFIPILENTGMIFEVGRWALKRATADYAAWRAKGLTPPRIAVNVSSIQLRQKDFVESVRTAVAEGGGYADRIDLELTESMVMEDIEGNIRKLGEIRAAGMQIAIDDFGTGYSSLSYLARLPVDALKIDRSFIVHMATQPDQMAIVSAVISLAHSLNLKVTAEGVETEEQRNLLKLLKCDEMQGYLFSRPLPVAEVEAKFLGAAAAT